MDVLVNSINRITANVTNTIENLSAFSNDELSNRPAEGKWSKKEIIGHLCDSAVNNLSRFIRAQFEPEPFVVTRYSQNEWVKLNGYNEMDINDVLSYWQSLNRQIVHIIRNIPPDKLAVKLDLGDAAFREEGENKNLLWLIEDYVIHMEHHLKQVK